MGFWEGVKEGWKKGKAEAAKRNVLLHYWPELIPNLSYSPQEFYALVVKNIKARQIPGLQVQHLMIRQGGVGSPERLYLQLRRERLFVEICGVPFGTGFFVSGRVFHRRPYGAALRLVFGLMVLTGIALQATGWVGVRAGWGVGIMAGLLTFTGIIVLLWSLMRLAAANVAEPLDRALGDLPLLGSVYEWFFHPDTYFRQDTNRAYSEAVGRAFRQSVEEIKTQKGIKPSPAEERSPFVDDMHLR